jgi:hypothetical protein
MSYADALSGLVELEEVFLGLPGYLSSIQLPSSLAGFETALLIIIKRMPSLKVVGVQRFSTYDELSGMRADNLRWEAWDVVRTPDAEPTLRYAQIKQNVQGACWVGRDL